jgi:hypothetical protein
MPAEEDGEGRSRWSSRVIIELRWWPNPDRQINPLASGRVLATDKPYTPK